MPLRLEGKVALITGAGRGIGLAIASRFQQEGATVLLNDLNVDGVSVQAQALDARYYACDVGDSAAVDSMFAAIRADVGRLDILVNNAGINGSEGEDVSARHEKSMRQMEQIQNGQPITEHNDTTIELSDDKWRRMMRVHLDGTFYCSRAALKLMRKGAAPGVILNLGSIMGTAGGAGASHYCAAKAGILGFTRALAREVATRNIRVNAIAPGWIETDMTSNLGPLAPVLAAQTPMLRFGDVDDIAHAAVYLASDEAKFVTGQVLSPNGGWHMSQ